MRTLVSCFALAVALLGVSKAAAEETAWTKVVTKEGGIAAMFPGKPKATKADNGGQALLEADGGATIYLLVWTKLPGKVDIEDEEIVKRIMENAEASAVKALPGAKVLKSEEAEYCGLPARNIDLDAPGIGIYRTHVILEGTKLFQVTIAGKKEVVESDDSAAFLHSFRTIED